MRALLVFLSFSLIGNIALAAGKYGVVDMQKVILTVKEGKAARTALEKQIKGKEAEFMSRKKELDKLNKSLASQNALLSANAKMAKQKEFQEKFVALRNEEMKFQNEIKKKEGEATQKIAIKVSQLVQGIAEKKKLEVVFETNSSGLLYLKDPVELTNEVIAQYDKSKK